LPRDSTATRIRLVEEAERLFAKDGIWQAAINEIVTAAEQKNASALTYHFQSRQGVLDYILTEHGSLIDSKRGELLLGLSAESSTHEILEALVRPMVRHMAKRRGRHYIRIVAQLASQFPMWRDAEIGPENQKLFRALDILERRPPHLAETIRRERLVAMMQLMTSSLAERARQIDTGSTVILNEADYTDNLTAMLTGVLEAQPTLST